MSQLGKFSPSEYLLSTSFLLLRRDFHWPIFIANSTSNKNRLNGRPSMAFRALIRRRKRSSSAVASDERASSSASDTNDSGRDNLIASTSSLADSRGGSTNLSYRSSVSAINDNNTSPSQNVDDVANTLETESHMCSNSHAGACVEIQPSFPGHKKQVSPTINKKATRGWQGWPRNVSHQTVKQVPPSKSKKRQTTLPPLFTGILSWWNRRIFGFHPRPKTVCWALRLGTISKLSVMWVPWVSPVFLAKKQPTHWTLGKSIPSLFRLNN